MQQKCFTHTSILSQIQGLQFNTICIFAALLRRVVGDTGLFPQRTPPSSWGWANSTSGQEGHSWYCYENGVGLPGPLYGSRRPSGPTDNTEPLPWRGRAVHSAHLCGVKTEGSHLHTRAAIWVWPRSVKFFYGHGNSDSMQFLHVTKH